MALKILFDVRTDELQTGDAVVCCANGTASIFRRLETITGLETEYVRVVWEHGGESTSQPWDEWCTVVRQA